MLLYVHPGGIYLLKVNKRNTRVRCEICLKLTIKTPERRSYSGPYFPAFGLNAERYKTCLRIQSECGKIRTRMTPNTFTFHAVIINVLQKELMTRLDFLHRYSHQRNQKLKPPVALHKKVLCRVLCSVACGQSWPATSKFLESSPLCRWMI